MEFAYNPRRATKDMDLTCSKRMRIQRNQWANWFYESFKYLLRVNLNDHFIFQIGQPQSDIENAPYGGSRQQCLRPHWQQAFAEFHLDVGGDFIIDRVRESARYKLAWVLWHCCSNNFHDFHRTTICGKAPFIHSPRLQINTRTKDLIVLLLLLKFNNRASEAFQYSLQRVYKARNTHVLPEILPEPPAELA